MTRPFFENSQSRTEGSDTKVIRGILVSSDRRIDETIQYRN